MNPLLVRFQDILGDITDISHRLGRSALPYACLSQARVAAFRRQIETISTSSSAIFAAIALNDCAIDERIVGWLVSGEPCTCLDKLKEMDNMLKRDSPARPATVALARPQRTTEERLSATMAFFDRYRTTFRFLLDSDVW